MDFPQIHPSIEPMSTQTKYHPANASLYIYDGEDALSRYAYSVS